MFNLRPDRYASGDTLEVAGCPVRLRVDRRAGRLPRPQPFGPGAVIEILGQPCRLAQTPTRRGQGFSPGGELRLCAFGEGEAFTRSAVRLLKSHALKVLTERSAAHAATLGQPVPKVSVMDARSRWGSCTPARGLRAAGVRYSWRLILAPYEVMDYVAAHECAHLVQADHSPRFWAVVKRLVPDVRGCRAWLRTHGPRLHATGR